LCLDQISLFVIVTTEYMVKHWLAEPSPVSPWLGRSAIATVKMSLAKLGKSDPRACKNGELRDHGWSSTGNSYATKAEIWVVHGGSPRKITSCDTR
jgi:hypothetical protein